MLHCIGSCARVTFYPHSLRRVSSLRRANPTPRPPFFLVQRDAGGVTVADPWAVKYVEPAFSGNEGLHSALHARSATQTGGEVAVAMWEAKIPRPAFRVFLEDAWGHDHDCVIEAAGTRRRLAALFRYAAFALPDIIGETVSVWRGTSRQSMTLARADYSWTLSRDMAYWFAMWLHGPARTPIVLRGEVARSEITLYTDEREESEVVLCARLPPVWTALLTNGRGVSRSWRLQYVSLVVHNRSEVA